MKDRIKFTRSEVLEYLEEHYNSNLLTDIETKFYENIKLKQPVTLKQYAHIQRNMNKLYNEKY